MVGPNDVSLAVETVSRNDVLENVHVQLPLLLRRKAGHVVRVQEIAREVVCGEGVGQRDGYLLTLGHVDDTDRLPPLLGDERVLDLDEGDGATTAHGLHAGQSLTGDTYQKTCPHCKHRGRAGKTHLGILRVFYILDTITRMDSR